MGQEISKSHYSADDFAEFHRRLARETCQLQDWINSGVLAEDSFALGFELELWLVDSNLRPAPAIERFLELSEDDPLMVSELAAFNLELNGPPTAVAANSASQFHRSITQIWHRAQRHASVLGLRLLMAGILPSLRQEDLTLANMSPMRRYQALNQQVMRLRQGRPLQIDIEGEDQLHLEVQDVMLESACTSFQLHLQIPLSQAKRAYNSAKILSAAMVALSANSPLVFDRRLWDESRIPLFEQAIDVGASDLTRRVTFGLRYARESIFEAFTANLERYPVLVPSLFDGGDGSLEHLRFHNGTIWRWNRPLIGFIDDVPHLRIEHRVMPSGPSLIDMVANALVFFGALRALLDEPELEQRLPFAKARDSFYRAARNSLEADLDWLDQKHYRGDQLLRDEILPLAISGLDRLGIKDAGPYLDIVEQRLAAGINGAIWQARYLKRHRNSAMHLLDTYARLQSAGRPLHQWEER